MQRVSNTSITLTRGDTFKADIILTDSTGAPYVPDAGDEIRFAMKEDYCDSVPAIVKVIPNDSLLLWLEPEDTKSLPIGKYVYDIQITFANGDVDTFINRASFTLAEEVD